MDDDSFKFSNAFKELAVSVHEESLDPSKIQLIKKNIANGYSQLAFRILDRAFMNWGLWEKNLLNEYSKLGFDFSRICGDQDINSQLLQYFLIRPLIQKTYFHKKLLDIGCGNGTGLKISSELLRAKEAVGADMSWWSIMHASKNFHQKDKIHFILSDAEELAFPNESFDIITSLESSHLYPQLENFYKEVARILVPGGYFCYADIQNFRQQAGRFEIFIQSQSKLKIIQKINITKMVQGSIHNRLIVNEKTFYENAKIAFGDTAEILLAEITALAEGAGISFLPWWKIRFKEPLLRALAKRARRNKYWGKKLYFYYLVQKV